MNPSKLLHILLILIAVSLGCGPEAEKPATKIPEPPTPATKDLKTFELPPEIRKAAPEIQGHLHKLMIFNGPSHKIQPLFVFQDGKTTTYGPYYNFGNWLHFYHAAYYQKGNLAWSGSLMLMEKKGTTLHSRAGYLWDLIRKDDGTMSMSFKDHDFQCSVSFSEQRDHAQWCEGDQGNRLFFYYYMFPKDQILGKQRSEPKQPAPQKTP